jgi:hypothetical protein
MTRRNLAATATPVSNRNLRFGQEVLTDAAVSGWEQGDGTARIQFRYWQNGGMVFGGRTADLIFLPADQPLYKAV